MKTLEHGQHVYVESWGKNAKITIFALKGSCEKNNSDYLKALDRAVKNGHELAATIQIGTVITNSHGYYEREDAKAATAIELKAGEEVEIEGRKYTVKLMGKNYSDPIHFIPCHSEERRVA